METNYFNELQNEIENLETTEEGLLRGGFAMIGGNPGESTNDNNSAENCNCNCGCAEPNNCGKNCNCNCNCNCPPTTKPNTVLTSGLGLMGAI